MYQKTNQLAISLWYYETKEDLGEPFWSLIWGNVDVSRRQIDN
ncbi:hypothetical protein [Levilactobacillus fuyuanensis]|uniref:Uncharacterized protein n=1 Tax=Levilactobacillus fuyuanensis TaxID=2486022 RepID=A0ABW4H1U4_9LACO|nr:hypothetical protein [Levilactobacillus fuyuanensis]